jgi:hypothetical protein
MIFYQIFWGFFLVMVGDKELKSWVYDTCNGYRNMNPTYIDFSLTEKNQVAISFNQKIKLQFHSIPYLHYGIVIIIWNLLLI